MAKRKRLELPVETISADLETKHAFPPAPRARMPIADVAGDTAGRAALEEVAREMTVAEEEGRVVKKIPLEQIDLKHLTRDRLHIDEDELAELTSSISNRGQQTPIEVVRTGPDSYGLISGLRRMYVLKDIGAPDALALIRSPDYASDAYVAMIDENELRAQISFYERANIVAEAAAANVFPNVRSAIAYLFDPVSSAKRSKIARFVIVRDALHDALTFPAAIPEKLGLALANALEADTGLATRIRDALRKTPPMNAAAERKTLEKALKKTAPPKPEKITLAPGLTLEAKAGRAVLSGKAVDKDFLEDLQRWADSR